MYGTSQEHKTRCVPSALLSQCLFQLALHVHNFHLGPRPLSNSAFPTRPLPSLPQSIFVFNKYYLDEEFDEVIKLLHLQPPLQPPIEGKFLISRARDPA
jgi:hypothetical protein